MATGAELRTLEYRMREDARADLIHTNGGVGGNLLLYRNGRGLQLVGSLIPNTSPTKQALRQKYITCATLMFVTFVFGVAFMDYPISGLTYFAIPAISYFWIKTWVNANRQVISTDGRDLLFYFQDNVDRIWAEESQKIIAGTIAKEAQTRAEIERKMRE